MALTPRQRQARRSWMARALAWEDGMNGASGIPVDLFVSVTQSNEAWATPPSTTNSATLTDGYAYEFAMPDSIRPLGNGFVGHDKGGWQRAFSEQWVTDGGNPVVYVPMLAPGARVYDSTGSNTNSYDLGTTGNLYTAKMKPRLDAAIAAAAGRGLRIARLFVVWNVGRTDAQAYADTVIAANWESHAQAVHDQIKSDFADLFTHAFVITTGDPSSGTRPAEFAAVRAAQTSFIANNADVSLGYSNTNQFNIGNGGMVDEEHYSQTAQNTIGAALATAAQAVMGDSFTPDVTPFDILRLTTPALTGFKRCIITTNKSGSANPQTYVDPLTPFETTYFDTSGENPSFAGQSCTFSWSDTSEKQVAIYLADTAGASVNFVSGTIAASVVDIPVAGFRANTFNFGATGSMAAGCYMSEQSLLNIATTLRTLLMSNGSTGTCSIELTNTVLAYHSALTHIRTYGNDSLGANLDFTLTPNLTQLQLINCGLTTADVNAILIALDSNGLSGGTIIITQGGSAPPSGAGATAKTSLQGKGWSVTTD